MTVIWRGELWDHGQTPVVRVIVKGDDGDVAEHALPSLTERVREWLDALQAGLRALC